VNRDRISRSTAVNRDRISRSTAASAGVRLIERYKGERAGVERMDRDEFLVAHSAQGLAGMEIRVRRYGSTRYCPNRTGLDRW
jgi:hypothetical protein